MGLSITDILGGGTLGAVSSIIKDFKGDPEDKAKLQTLVETNQAAFQVADLQANVQLNQIASDNIKADAQSASWMAKNSRPFFLFAGAICLFFNYTIPTFANLSGHPMVPVALPPQFYTLYGAAFLGYVAGRTTEKVTGSDN